MNMKFIYKGFVFLDDCSEYIPGGTLKLDIQKDLTFHWTDFLNSKGTIIDFNKHKLDSTSWESSQEEEKHLS